MAQPEEMSAFSYPTAPSSPTEKVLLRWLIVNQENKNLHLFPPHKEQKGLLA